VLRGIFLLRRWELEWFYQRGTSLVFPDAFAKFEALIPEGERHDLIAAYHRRLTSTDADVRQQAARVWSVWEASTSNLIPDEDYIRNCAGDVFSLAFARIESHYFVNGGFLERENQLIEDVGRIRQIPAVIVQGRYDVVCPATSAWELSRAWPEARLAIVPDAGHSAYEPGIVHELISATDAFATADSSGAE
jgi:proline iminopeptidase